MNLLSSLDHCVCLDGGISPKNIALAFKEFENLVSGALQEVRAALAKVQAAKPALDKQRKSSFPESRTTSDRAMLSSSPSPRIGF